MPYVARAAVTVTCPQCQTTFSSRHQRRKYCSNSCNVLASQARRNARIAPVAAAPEDESSFALPLAWQALVGPIEQTSQFYYLVTDETLASPTSRVVAPHRAQQPVRWVAIDTQEPFLRQEFLVGLDGTAWLQAAGYDGRFFQVVAEAASPPAPPRPAPALPEAS